MTTFVTSLALEGNSCHALPGHRGGGWLLCGEDVASSKVKSDSVSRKFHLHTLLPPSHSGPLVQADTRQAPWQGGPLAPPSYPWAELSAALSFFHQADLVSSQTIKREEGNKLRTGFCHHLGVWGSVYVMPRLSDIY